MFLFKCFPYLNISFHFQLSYDIELFLCPFKSFTYFTYVGTSLSCCHCISSYYGHIGCISIMYPFICTNVRCDFLCSPCICCLSFLNDICNKLIYRSYFLYCLYCLYYCVLRFCVSSYSSGENFIISVHSTCSLCWLFIDYCIMH